MKLKLVQPRQGALWVRQGLAVFFRRPLAFCVLFLVYMLVGPLVMFAVAPLATAGFMIATRQALEGRFPFPGVFIDPLRAAGPQRWAQLKLALAYAIGIAIVFWLGDIVGGRAFDALRDAVAAGRTSPQELEPLLSDNSLQWGWLILAGGVTLLAVPFWHAPSLVHWGAQSAAKAMFFSTVACWRNKGALTIYSLGWGAVIMVFALLSTTVFALLGVPQMAFAALTPAMLMLSAAFYASLYFTFADSFEVTERIPAVPQET
jgi:hypothetical protein